ncbi:MAG: glutaredoxin family protein [Mycobacteriales bacterium]
MSDDDIVMYGTAWCGDCKRAKQFLSRAGCAPRRSRSADVRGP